MHVMAGDNESQLAAALVGAGFQVAPARRLVGGIHVRVRTDTTDEETVSEIIERVAPSATLGPSGSLSTTHRDGYRDDA
jgi:hypothetical protein